MFPKLYLYLSNVFVKMKLGYAINADYLFLKESLQIRQMYGHCHECIQSGHCHDCSVYSVIKDTRTGTPNWMNDKYFCNIVLICFFAKTQTFYERYKPKQIVFYWDQTISGCRCTYTYSLFALTTLPTPYQSSMT